jgi:hypothetical protein
VAERWQRNESHRPIFETSGKATEAKKMHTPSGHLEGSFEGADQRTQLKLVNSIEMIRVYREGCGQIATFAGVLDATF